MTTTLQIVDDSGTVLFDLNDSTGANNAAYGSVKTTFGLGGAFNLGAPEAEFSVVSPSSAAGGSVVQRRDPLVRSSWRTRIWATSYDNLVLGIGELARLLSNGGILKWVPSGSSETRYIDFEPSAQPALFVGAALELQQAIGQFDTPEGIHIEILRQPYLRSAELLASVNKVKNGCMVIDNDGTSGRPDNWAWDSTSNISSETISATSQAYQFAVATASDRNLQQTTAASTFASGDVVTFSFYAKVSAVAGTPRINATVQFKEANGTTNVGSLHSGTRTTLTTSWQRISVTTTAAGASTSRAVCSMLVQNSDATSVTMLVRNAQAEVASAASAFRVGAEAVAYDPASTSYPARALPVYGQGNAPSLATVKVTADASTLTKFKVYRATTDPVSVLKSTLYKQLEGGTMGTMTAGTADANASGGTAAAVTYTASTPALRADSASGGTGNTITVTKPSGTASGDVLVALVWRADETSAVACPSGWKMIGSQTQTTNTFTLKHILYAFLKVADATDEAATTTDYTFTVVYDGAGTRSYRAWIGAFQNIDNTTPLDTFDFSTEGNTTAPTADSITTTADNAMIVTAYAGVRSSAAALTWTAPSGTTPTYTEQDDGTADVNYRGMAVYTGVLATAGATGTKDATAVSATDTAMVNLALKQAPATLAARSTVTFTSLEPGTYDLWLRFYPTAASRQRIRAEYALRATPTTWIALPDVVVDTTAASAFAYVSRNMGRIHIPEDFTLATLTVRFSSGLEATSSAVLRLDECHLCPSDEHVATAVSPTNAASGEILVADASADKVFHLDSSSQLLEVGQAEGPVPVELQPGLNVLWFEFQQDKATGFVDNAAVLAAVPTVSVDHSPRFRA